MLHYGPGQLHGGWPATPGSHERPPEQPQVEGAAGG